MKTTFARGSAFAALCLCLAVFTGTALADNGNGNNGNGNGNAAAGNPATPLGQEKKADQSTTTTQAPPAAEQTAPAAAVPATTPHGNPSAPGQEKKAASSSAPSSQGQAKQAAKADVSTPGVKPSNTTSHWTHCTTGGTTANTTCAGNGPKADGSKQYEELLERELRAGGNERAIGSTAARGGAACDAASDDSAALGAGAGVVGSCTADGGRDHGHDGDRGRPGCGESGADAGREVGPRAWRRPRRHREAGPDRVRGDASVHRLAALDRGARGLRADRDGARSSHRPSGRSAVTR